MPPHPGRAAPPLRHAVQTAGQWRRRCHANCPSPRPPCRPGHPSLACFLYPPPIHLDEFLYGRRIGWALVFPHPGEAWEADGEAAALPDDVPSGRVHRAQGDLRADRLEDDCRLKPYVGDDAREPAIVFEAIGAEITLSPVHTA